MQIIQRLEATRDETLRCFQLGEPELARKNLTAFLSYYHEHDGWTRNAQLTLARLAAEAER